MREFEPWDREHVVMIPQVRPLNKVWPRYKQLCPFIGTVKHELESLGTAERRAGQFHHRPLVKRRASALC
jgi:hypothetical protein